MSVRIRSIETAVRRSFPDTADALVTEVIAHAATSAVALAELDKHLTAHPTALVSGASSAPPSVVRLVAHLQAAGVPAVNPACAKCGQAKNLPYKVGEERWCQPCRARSLAETCVSCGKVRRVNSRTPAGPQCSSCDRQARPEPCASCGAVKPVYSRRDDGPRCQACTARPVRPCSICSDSRPAHAYVDGRPVCRSCYRQPHRRCGVCGQDGRIEVAATGGAPDICIRCYTAPLQRCPDCGVREPCTHDQEYYQRPGHEHLTGLDPLVLAKRRRLAPRPLHECARCERHRPAQALWPMGPVCSGCYDAVLGHPAPCPACGTTLPLIGASGPEPVCGPCAGDDRTYACRECGTPSRAVADGRCARCVARHLLQDLAAQGSDEWRDLPMIASLTDSPLALVAWLRRSSGAQTLASLVRTGAPLTHDLLDTRPQGKDLHYLRGLLVEASLLPRREEYLDRLPLWVEALLEGETDDVRTLVRRFAQWHVLRRARRRGRRRDFTENSGRWARQQVSVARDFLNWLSDHDRTLETCTQADIDLWLASGSTRRTVIRNFLAWARRNRLTSGGLIVPPRHIREPSAPTSEAERWSTLRHLLVNERVPDDVRVAGALVLLYGLHLSRIVAITPQQVELASDGATATITPAKSPLPLPGPLVAALRRLLEQEHRAKAAVGRTGAAERWLLPGGQPGRHITAEHLRTRLAEHGVTLRPARHAALIQWATDTPAPILATSLGLHINTAVAWRAALQADYAGYVAARPTMARDAHAER